MTDSVNNEEKKSAPAAGENKEGGNTEGRRPARRQGGRKFQRRRKFCKFCADKTMVVDYKDPELLSQFVTDRYKILPSRVTGTCSKHQRALTTAVKRARVLALLAFTPLHHD